jgi:hypothetical protein
VVGSDRGHYAVRYYLDSEFYEDGRTIDLISIALVAEDGREFYACSLDAELHRCDAWMRTNVLPHLPPYSDKAWMTRDQIRDGIARFIFTKTQSEGEPWIVDYKAEFWGYYADYDWVVFCQLWKRMVDLPRHFPKHCMDLKQYAVDRGNPKLPPKPVDAHNALADARWNRDVHKFLTGLDVGMLKETR